MIIIIITYYITGENGVFLSDLRQKFSYNSGNGLNIFCSSGFGVLLSVLSLFFVIALFLTSLSDRVQLKLAVLMYRCLHGTVPLYLMNSCPQTADVVSQGRRNNF